MKCQTILLKKFFGLKGAVYYEAIAMAIFSRVKIHMWSYVIHRLGGPYWEKLCPRSWVPPEAVGNRQFASSPGTLFCLNNKIHFSLANADNSASFKRKMVLNHRFCSFTTTNKLVNEAVNDSARVSGQDRKNCPLSEPIRLQDFEDSAPSQAQKKNKTCYFQMWRYHVFARKLTWYFIGVYIIIPNTTRIS